MFQIIANQNSGCGAGTKALRGAEEVLRGRGLDFQTAVTEKAGDATRIADRAVSEGRNQLICVGGEGTIFEIVNGIAGRFASLYFVPCGTGNDFVRMLSLPADPAKALEAQLDGRPRRIDVGRVNDRWFMNIAGSGFDVEVLLQAARFKRLGRGILPYLMGIFSALRRFHPLTVEITLDGRTETRVVTIFSVGNGSYFGGGMKAVPRARIDDGLFDVIIADGMSRLSILKFLGRFISGRHTELAAIRECRCSELTVRCPGMTVELDGELVPMDEAHFRILPGALEIHA